MHDDPSLDYRDLLARLTGVPAGVHLHPTQLYETAMGLVMFAVL